MGRCCDSIILTATLNSPKPVHEQGQSGNEVDNELANRMSLFYASATPMLKMLSDATSKFVSDVSLALWVFILGNRTARDWLTAHWIIWARLYSDIINKNGIWLLILALMRVRVDAGLTIWWLVFPLLWPLKSVTQMIEKNLYHVKLEEDR